MPLPAASVACPTLEVRDHVERDFARHHIVRLPGLLRGDLLGRVLDGIGAATFREHLIAATNRREQIMEQDATSALLLLLTSDPALSELVGALTATERPAAMVGRVYRMVPGAGHVGDWHTDVIDGRVAALSINLSPEPFEGGETTVRDSATKEPLGTGGAAHLVPGDAVLLRIRPGIEHRVSEVTGHAAKTSYVCFFRDGAPSLLGTVPAAAV
ncbi:2OG-Fe(II) oxygenase [Paraconexibacter sp.]|uniref:2OG-Fe(II) oxygenase n=1 Tax=Paraconexibacter sp. TaxID=2949640 RepID=UPI003561E62A